MERTKRFKKDLESSIERQIVIGLITNTDYIKQIREKYDPRFLESATAKKLASWCFEYYDKYQKAINRNIEGIYCQKLKEGKQPKELMEEIEQDILPSLSTEYEKEGTDQFLLDQTINYFQERHLQIHGENILTLVNAGQKEEAEKLAKEFKPLEIITTNKLNSFIWSLDDMRKQDRTEPRLFMKPWLRAGQFTFIYGDYGTGKSLLAINIAYLLGLKDFNEQQHEIGEWQVKSPTGCLYVDGELGAVELENRISQFEWLGEQRENIKTLSFPLPEYQLETEDEFMLSERPNQLQIIQWLKEHTRYKLLVLDSVTTLFGLTEENSNSEWSKKINPFLRDLRALGVACILLHHAGKDSRRGLRGASAMGAMAHNIFCLTNHMDKDIDEGEAWFTISKNKQRSGGFEFKKFSVHYFQDSGLTNTEWEITEGGEKRNEELTQLQIKIIKYFLHGKLKQQEIAERVGCNRSNISLTIKRVKKLGYLTQDGKPTQLWKDLIGKISNTGEVEKDE